MVGVDPAAESTHATPANHAGGCVDPPTQSTPPLTAVIRRERLIGIRRSLTRAHMPVYGVPAYPHHPAPASISHNGTFPVAVTFAATRHHDTAPEHA